MRFAFARIRLSLYRLVWGDPMYDWMRRPVAFRVRRAVHGLVPTVGLALLGLFVLRGLVVGVVYISPTEHSEPSAIPLRGQPVVFERRCFHCHEPSRPFELRRRHDSELNFDDINATAQVSQTSL